ncbi:MAG: DUF3298 domain-containing protein [Oscillospiraceae bacterium]|nr:DUF3298 domain-containing protein [Oscillospiraceae bacterium]
MRRVISLLLLVCLLITAAGCKKQTPTTADTVPSAESTTVTAPADVKPMKQLPMVAVSMPIVYEPYTAEDNTLVFSSTYQNMSLITADPEVADKIIIDYLNQIEKFTSAATIQPLQRNAVDAYRQLQNKSDWAPHTTEITYGVTRIDPGILSLIGEYIAYTGGAHAEIHNQTLNYDLLTGNRLSLSDILDSSVNPDYICALVLKHLAGYKDLFDNYEALVKDRFKDNVAHENDWFLTNEGLSFWFSRYEIAPYSAGSIPVSIPYSELTGILKDEYFPAERQQAGGTVQVSPFDEGKLNQYTQFAELVMKDGEDKILLYSDKGVYDILIKTVDVSNGSMSTPHTVFASYALSPGDAIMIDSVLEKQNPGLALFYCSNNSKLYNLIVPDGDYLVTADEFAQYFESNP